MSAEVVSAADHEIMRALRDAQSEGKRVAVDIVAGRQIFGRPEVREGVVLIHPSVPTINGRPIDPQEPRVVRISAIAVVEVTS